MSWRQENGPDGLPVWHGQDEILNVLKNLERRSNSGGLNWLGGGSIGCGGLVCLFFASVLGRHAGPLWFMGFIFIALGVITYAVVTKRANIDPWQGNHWALHIGDGKAVFRCQPDSTPSPSVPPKWVVALDAVARVEIAQTAQYVPARNYGTRGHDDDFKAVPAHEWQVFLFMADGTRRVIYHANAARDDCAALAASIREHVERLKTSAPASAAPVADAPRAAGFDL